MLQALLIETLNEDDEKRPEQEMEITFEPGLQETAEQLVQRKLGESFILQSTQIVNLSYQRSINPYSLLNIHFLVKISYKSVSDNYYVW